MKRITFRKSLRSKDTFSNGEGVSSGECGEKCKESHITMENWNKGAVREEGKVGGGEVSERRERRDGEVPYKHMGLYIHDH